MNMNSMGERIRQAREAAGMTQQELADRVGLSRSTVGGIERDLISPRLETVQRMATVLRCITAYLLYGKRGWWARLRDTYPPLQISQPRGITARTIDVPQTTYSAQEGPE
jgi:transcriptional regulator with XRE-family HTH domain